MRYHLYPRGSVGRPTGSQGGKGLAYRVPGGQGKGLRGPRRSREVPKGQGVGQGSKGLADGVPGGQRAGRQGPRGSRGRLRGSRGVKG